MPHAYAIQKIPPTAPCTITSATSNVAKTIPAVRKPAGPKDGRSCALVAGLAGISATSAQAVVVNAYTNSSSGGSGGSTGVFLTVGQIFNVDVNANDLWNADPLPRWSNADGLLVKLYATGRRKRGLSPPQPGGGRASPSLIRKQAWS